MQSTQNTLTSQSVPLTPMSDDSAAGLSSSSNHSTSGMANNLVHGLQDDTPASIPPVAQQPTSAEDHTGAGVSGRAGNDPFPIVQHVNHTVRFNTDLLEDDSHVLCNAAPAPAVASDATYVRPQRHHCAPTNPDGTHPVNLPGSRSSAVGNVDTVTAVGAKRKRSGSGAEVRKCKSV